MDIDKAKQALEADGWTLQNGVYTKGDLKTEFSIGHIDPNPVAEPTRCAAPFVVRARPAEDHRRSSRHDVTPIDGTLDSGNFNVALFAWTGSPLISGSTSTFIPPDAGWRQQQGQVGQRPDRGALRQGQRRARPGRPGRQRQPDRRHRLGHLATIPLFQFADLVANSDKVQNVVANPTQQDITWNAPQWRLAAS